MKRKNINPIINSSKKSSKRVSADNLKKNTSKIINWYKPKYSNKVIIINWSHDFTKEK